MANGRNVQQGQGVPETSSAFHRAVDPLSVDACKKAKKDAIKLGYARFAEDISQEVAVRLFDALRSERTGGQRTERERLSNPDALSTWVLSKTSEVGRTMRRGGTRADKTAAKSLVLNPVVESAFDQPDVAAMQTEIAQLADQALEELSDTHREVLKAVYGVEECKYHEVAKRLGLTRDQVRRYLAQALAALPADLVDYKDWDASTDQIIPRTQGTRANFSLIPPKLNKREAK